MQFLNMQTIKKLIIKTLKCNTKRIACGFIVLLCFVSQNLFAQSIDSATLSQTAQGKKFFHVGIGTFPFGANLSFHYFLADRVSISPDLNVASISSTEYTKVVYYRSNGQQFYTGSKIDSRNSIGLQLGVRLNLHFKKKPKRFDPYFAIGLHYTIARDNFRDVESGYSFGKNTYLQSTDNYFLPVSAAFGYRVHMKKSALFTEIGFGSYISRVGLAFKLN